MTTPNHSERGHAEFSPSSLKYVAACPAYKGRDGTSAAAEKGTRIHEALEVRDPSALHDEEEVEIYDQIVKMEADFMANFPPVKEEHNEIQVTVELEGTRTWGTCDRFLILECATRAVMADYKTGISIIDPPEKNWQAKAYIVGAFQRYPMINEITFVFYVPLHNACLSHTFHRSDLPVLIHKLSKVIKMGELIRPMWDNGGQPDIEDCTPTQYCRFCKFEDNCPALGGLSLEVAKTRDPSLDVDFNNLDDPANRVALFRIAKIVESWAANVMAKVKEAALAGEDVGDLSLRSMGRTRTVEDNLTLVSIAEEHGLSIEEVLNNANLPLAKIAKAVAAQHPKGERKEFEQIFVDACESAGIIRTSDERFTLTDRQ